MNLLDNEFYAFPFLIGGTNYSLNNVNVINNKLKKSFGPRGWLNFNQSTITLFSENHNINGLETLQEDCFKKVNEENLLSIQAKKVIKIYQDLFLINYHHWLF